MVMPEPNTPGESTSPKEAARPLLEAGLESKVILPDDVAYATWIESYWCNSAKLRPACICQPRSTAQVAQAVVALAQARRQFAVRSGGHGNWSGINNIGGQGVTLDLGALNAVEYDGESQTVRLGPAAKWKNVYAELEQHGRAVCGAREAEVGVGGFLLSGGNSFYTARLGFACDNVVAYELVLADGRILNVDGSGPHADLFRVLKGGGNNFGIVTCFTMSTFPSSPIWGGLAVRPVSVVPEAVDAFVDFTAKNHEDVDSNLQLVFACHPRFGGNVVITLCNNMAGAEVPPVLKKSVELPDVMNNFDMTTVHDLLPLTSMPTDYFNIWYTSTFRNKSSILLKAAALHEELVKELQSGVPDNEFTSHVAFQPLPHIFAEQSHRTGGNILGLERNFHDGMLMQASISVRTPYLEAWARPKVSALVQDLRAFADGVDEGGNIDWIYMNYAAQSQQVLQSYGLENVQKMRDAAARYDPDGVFQELCPGGFKLAAIKG